ILPTAPPEY
nr:Chain C, Matrix protein VP40 [Ebola virus - Mayinga, Zaire, 1976]4EJE_D Chain D, Matrix protein VP40 [Ebola virus - Mayinga, Zaire, 1976]